MRAVVLPQLEHLTDVIVFSTKGMQSKVSFLSGGDYDGDLVYLWINALTCRFGFAGMRRS
jgi:RNA-dependent RNA polymerase